ncbi:MAG: hypothetical protein COC19_06590 [SAR86 cluster bacterium]|uniref:VWA domain-containing protein n=1 Tax=SAR86 cluster bacterium TaxID=2030880 RepID=A0A2A4MJF4_9GAMM|nr:MAG: hypothetical protein COC19_06590 [SAR86 cluster bacterium]
MSKSANKQANKNNKTLSSSGDVKNFLAKVNSLPTATQANARLVFSLDATASRQASWDQACHLQTQMFLSTQALGSLQIQLCYFRGFKQFFYSDWQTDSAGLLRLMSGIRCEAGATQLQKLLRHVVSENTIKPVKSVVFIGDAMEESRDILCQLAGELGLLNIPLFIFQEGDDASARQCFQEMARLSNGAYSHFDSSSIEQLKELLKAVAVYCAGGLKALRDFSQHSNQQVKRLEQQLKF